jgi:two-component system, OmpR family, sensor histidine kinase KdpD
MNEPTNSKHQSIKEHLLVCISSNVTLSNRLIQKGREMANSLQADWDVIHIQRPAYHRYTSKRKDQMNQLLNLAESYGAKTESIFGSSIAEEIVKYAKMHNITTIIIGRPKKSWVHDVLFAPFSVSEGILRYSDTIDVHVIRETEPASQDQKHERSKFSIYVYLYAAVVVSFVSLISYLLTDILDPTNIIMFYLLAVVAAAILWGLWPAIFTAGLSVLTYDVLFVPPRFSITVADSLSIITFVVLFIVGVIISVLITRARDNATAARLGEQHISTLYLLSEDLTAAATIEDIAKALLVNIEKNFVWKVAVLFVKKGTLHMIASSKELVLDKKQLAEADLCLKSGIDIGLKTSPFVNSGLRFLPINTATDNFGVLAIKPLEPDETMTIEQERILHSFASLAALATSRVRSANQQV